MLEIYTDSGMKLFMSRDPELVQRIGEATALEVRATGIPYVFTPSLAVIDNSAYSIS